MSKAATRARLLRAARELIASGGRRQPTAGAVAARAGVSRLTVYDHFGSYPGLLRAVSETAIPPAIDAGRGLRAAITAACEHWATDPGLFRRLAPASDAGAASHRLASALAGADRLRPGCSLREAEDVISLATSFAAFDRLHGDGRRSPAAVAEILLRMAGAVLADLPA